MDLSDQELVARVRDGDTGSFRWLVERYSRSVFKLAYRMIGTEHDAEDVVQETFLRAYRQLPRYEARSSFGTWIYRIAANYSLDLLRARERRHEIALTPPNGDGGHSSHETPADDPQPDQVAFAGQLRRGFERAMKELSPQERTAFSLRHFEGCSIGQIADALEVSETAAKNSVFRAVQKLRRSMEPLVATVRGGSQ
jgi:RNA polymerase sigma-70 factor (ECF subfamily)